VPRAQSRGNRDVWPGQCVRASPVRGTALRSAAPLQVKEFFGSITTLRPERMGTTELHRIAARLQLDPASFDESDDRIVILRHTLMNPYLIDRENGISYIDRYFDYLAARVRVLA
jgi:hypothetical protein